MIFTIFHTGSGGNNYRLEFEDSTAIMLEAGKTSHFDAFREFCKRGERVENYAGLITTHEHKDHHGAVQAFAEAGMPIGVISTLCRASHVKIAWLELKHGCPCKGYIIANTTTREACVFLIDFYEIVNPANLYATLRWLVGEEYKIMFAVELSYCEFLYKKLPVEQRVGLDRHLSDEGFISLFKQLAKVAPIDNVVTLHASGREILNKGFHADVCPRDYLIKFLKVRLGKFINIGQNGMSYRF